MEYSITSFFTELYPSWQEHFPELPSHLECMTVEPGEQLPGYLGEIFFIKRGTIAIYQRKKPERFVPAGQIIIMPLMRHRLHLVSLEETKLYCLDRKKLYQLSEEQPRYIVLYDLIRERHDDENSTRGRILSLHKSERMDAFREYYPNVIPLISRQELADYLFISREYLRQIF